MASVEIRDTHGTVLCRRAGAGPGRVIDPEIAGEMNRMLMGVIAHGTGKGAQLDRPAAGKTGTTQDFHDALFVGYTADLVAGVWFGNDDNSPMKNVTGGTLPARTWKAFMVAGDARHAGAAAAAGRGSPASPRTRRRRRPVSASPRASSAASPICSTRSSAARRRPRPPARRNPKYLSVAAARAAGIALAAEVSHAR